MKKFLRITLKGERPVWFDVEVANDVNLGNVVGQLQLAGYFLYAKAWIPIGSIAHICVVEAAEQEPLDFTKARMQ